MPPYVAAAQSVEPSRAAGGAAEAGAMPHPLWLSLLLAVLHSGLFIAAFAPLDLWPLAMLAPAPLAWMALRAPSTARAIGVILPVQLLMWLVISWWIIQVAPIGLPLLALYLAAFGALLVWVIRRVGGLSGSALSRKRLVPMTVALPVIWTGVEFLRGMLFGGYPWYFIGHPLIEAPILVQSADLFGAYFASFLAAMVSGAIIDLLRVQAGEQARANAVTACAAVVAVFAGNIVYGAWRLDQEDVLREGPALLVIQTNLRQDNKMQWTAAQQVEDFQDFLHLTLDAHDDARRRGKPVDLIVWPETMVPGFGFETETIAFLRENDYYPGDWFTDTIKGLSVHLGVPLLVGSSAYLGIDVVDGQWTAEQRHNSAYLIDPATARERLEGHAAGRPGTPATEVTGPSGQDYQRYDKFFLTPFGERIPIAERWPWLNDKLAAFAARGMPFDLEPADDLRVIDLEHDGQRVGLATPICFEATVTSVIRRLVHDGAGKRADVMINLTNDGWFGFYGPGRQHHAQISRFRAIENRVPLVRAANTGLSVWIDSGGRLQAAAEGDGYGVPRVEGWLSAPVLLDARTAPYARIGDAWPWACLVLSGLGLIWTFGRSSIT